MSRNAERMIRSRNRSVKTLNALTDAVIADLVRRASVRFDGRKTGTGRSTFISDPTYTAVERNLMAKVSDPVFDTVKEISILLDEIHELAQRIETKVAFAVGAADRKRESTIIHCEACGREIAGTPNDRVRSGYCSADFQAWVRAGRPYRTQFEAERRARTEAKTR